MQACYNKDADLSLIKGKTIAIIDYGSQGHTHTANLKDPGMRVVVGLRQGSSWKKAEAAGLGILSVVDATGKADMAMILLLDENQPVVYKNEIGPNLKQGAALASARGFNIHCNQTVPHADLDVIMVVPKDPGHTVRSESLKGGNMPSLTAVYQNRNDKTHDIALSYAAANGGTKSGVIETNFREEIETDFFSEQTVLCGGVVELIKTGFEALTEAGYAPEMAYFERLHEMKLIADLIYEDGIANMNYSISNNTEYGGYVIGVEVINDKPHETTHNTLKHIQTGEYARMFIQEGAVNYASITARRRLTTDHRTEKVGAQLRSMMPWIVKSKLVGLDKN